MLKVKKAKIFILVNTEKLVYFLNILYSEKT